jgi:hypothetical protein
MFASRKSCAGLAAALAFSAFTAGCDGGTDLGISKPFSGAKEALLGKPTSTPNLPDRPGLLIPPPNAPLPVPGQASQTATQWQPVTDQPNQQASQDANAKSGSSSWFSGIFGSSDEKKTQQ